VSEARTGKGFRWNCRLRSIRASPTVDTSGVTGNLSAAGVYIRADAALEVGSPVEFEITLPPDVTGPAKKMSSSNAVAAWCGPTSLRPALPPPTIGVWPA